MVFIVTPPVDIDPFRVLAADFPPVRRTLKRGL